MATLYQRKFHRMLNTMPFSRHEREYVKAHFGKFSHFGSKGITQNEFSQGIGELETNHRDMLKPHKVDLLRKRGEGFFGGNKEQEE